MVDPELLRRLEDRIVRSVFGFLALLISLWSVYRFSGQMLDHALTPDWAWLYRTGIYIFENHGLPATDVFSWTHPEQPWVLYQWLFELSTARIYDVLGPSQTVAWFTLASLGVYVLAPALILRRHGVPAIITLVVGGLVLLPVSTNLGLRPMIVTSCFLLVQFVLVGRWRREQLGTGCFSVCIVALYVVWANTHMGVALGFLSLFLFALGESVDHSRGFFILNSKEHGTRHGRKPAILILTSLAGFAATMLNPYGVHIYPYLIDLALKTKINAHINELKPPDMTAPVFMLAGALVIIFLADLYRARDRYHAADILHVVVFSLLTAVSLRFVVWAGLFYTLVVPAGLWRWITHNPSKLSTLYKSLHNMKRAERTLLPAFGTACVAISIVIIPLMGSASVKGCPPFRDALIYIRDQYPKDTRWFSNDVTGSCSLMYAPMRKTFADTRFDMFPEEFVVSWLAAIKARQGWHDFIDRWAIDVLLVPKDSKLADELDTTAEFTPVYRDNGASIFERRDRR